MSETYFIYSSVGGKKDFVTLIIRVSPRIHNPEMFISSNLQAPLLTQPISEYEKEEISN
jgi:hypothetical protein